MINVLIVKILLSFCLLAELCKQSFAGILTPAVC